MNLAFAKKSSGSGGSKDKGGGSSGGDKGGGSGGGSSGSGDTGGGGSSDTGGGGSSDTGGGGSSDTGGGGSSDTGGGGSSSDTGGTSTPPPTTEETPPPPPATEQTTAPPPAASNQQTTTCPDSSTPDENGKCPSTTSTEQNTAPPTAATGEQSPCPDGSTPDPTTGNCPSPASNPDTTLAPNQGPTTTTTPPAAQDGGHILVMSNPDGSCPTGSHKFPGSQVCEKDTAAPPPTSGSGSGTGGSSTGTTTGATQPGGTNTGTTTGQNGHILVMSNPDGSCPAGSHKFPGSQVCEKDTATPTSSTGGQVPPECQGIIAGPKDKCSSSPATSPQTLTPQTCPPLPIDANGRCPGIDARGGGLGLPPPPPQPTPIGDGSYQLPTVSPVPNTNTIAPICPSGSHLELNKCVVDGVQCPSGTVQDGDKCSPSSAAAAGSQTQQVCGPNSPGAACAAAKAASGCPADATLSNGNCFKQTEVPANPDGRCPEGAYSVGSSGNAGQPGTGSIICLKNVPVEATPPPATPPTNTPPAEPSQPKQLAASLAATATPTALHVNSDGTLNTVANPDGSCPQGSDHTADPKQCKVISMPANQDGICPVHTSHFQGADAKQCFVDTALQTANTGVSTGTTPMPATTTTPVTCKTGEHLDTFSGKCLQDTIDVDILSAFTCPEDYHRAKNTRSCQSNIIPMDDTGKCNQGWHYVDVVSKKECTRDTTPSTQTSYTYVDVGQPLPSGACDKGTKIGDRCLLGAMDTGPASTCSAGDKIGNRCIIIPQQEIPMPKVLGHCPAGYHELTPGVSCAFNINIQTSTPATTQTGNNGGGGGGGASTTPTNTGSTTPSTTPMKTGTETNKPPAGGGGGTTTNTPTNTGNPNTTPPTTTTTTTQPSTSTTTTNVITGGGSSRGGGGGGSAAGGGGTSTAAPSQGSNGFLTYVNAANKITMKYPSSWTKTDLVGNPRIPVMFSAPTAIATTTPPGAAATKTSFVISITPSASNLDSFTQQQLNTLTNSKAIKYTITDANAKVLTPPTGITAFREVIYDAMKTNIPLKGGAIFFVNGGTGYSLLYLAKQTEYTQNLPMVQQMVNSFQIGSGAAANGSAPVQTVAASSSSSR